MIDGSANNLFGPRDFDWIVFVDKLIVVGPKKEPVYFRSKEIEVSLVVNMSLFEFLFQELISVEFSRQIRSAERKVLQVIRWQYRSMLSDVLVLIQEPIHGPIVISIVHPNE